MMKHVTFSAARRRFARHHKHYRHLSKLKLREASNMGRAYALMDGNVVCDVGNLKAVER